MPLSLASSRCSGALGLRHAYPHRRDLKDLHISAIMFRKSRERLQPKSNIPLRNGWRLDILQAPCARLATPAQPWYRTHNGQSKDLSSSLPSTDLRFKSQSTICSPPKAVYHPPSYGFLTVLPRKLVPYAELMRLEKPTGLYLFYFPYLFGLLFAAGTAHPITSPLYLLVSSTQFLVGTVIMRGAACTWNDIHDRVYDRLVARTCTRPIARGALSPFQGYVFTAVQSVLGLSLLASMPLQVTYYSLPVIALLGLYPFAKRVTNYPQVILGFPVAWGVFTGCASLGLDPVATWLGREGDSAIGSALGCFYLANIIWTIIYDTVYAHQDVVDDAKAGVKSIAVRHADHAKALLSSLAMLQTSMFLATGVLAEMGPPYYVGILGAGTSLATMIWRIDLKQPSECMRWFKNGAWLVGGSVTFGLLGQYLLVKLDLNGDPTNSKRALENPTH